MMLCLGIMQVNQLREWLKNWNEQFLDSGTKRKGKKQNDSGAKKAVLLSGAPGMGKTTSAKLVSQMLGFQAIEVKYILLYYHGSILSLNLYLNRISSYFLIPSFDLYMHCLLG